MMNIVARDIGYYEMGKIERFLDKLQCGYPPFMNLVAQYDIVTITYDVPMNKLAVIVGNRGNAEIVLYEDDLE